MIIKYYGFGKQFIGEEVLTEETALPKLDICGYEIFDEQGKLNRACFQGRIFNIEEIMDKDSNIMHLFPEKIQIEYKTLADKYYKQNEISKFIINVMTNTSNNVSFQPVLPCRETTTFWSKEQLEEIFINTCNEIFNQEKLVSKSL